MTARQQLPLRLFASLQDINALDVGSLATVRGFVTGITPTRQAKAGDKRYFNAEISEGLEPQHKVRCVGFADHQQETMALYHQQQTPVQIAGCVIKRPRFRDDPFQVFLTDTTTIGTPDEELEYDAQSVKFKKTPIPDAPITITLSHMEMIQTGTEPKD